MNRSMMRINALCRLKMQLIISNMSIMIAPLLSVGFVMLMKLVLAGKHVPTSLMGPFLLSMGLLFNVVMGGIMMSSLPLAEEKEHHTLRVLMTSSVTGTEFFIGSAVPPVVLMMIINVVLIPVSGVAWSQVPLLSYFVITLVASVISLLLGYLVGLYAQSQTQASILGMPLMLGLLFITSFRVFNTGIQRWSGYFYSGILGRLADGMFSRQGFHWQVQDAAVLLGWLVISAGLFIVAYRQHGLDAG